MNKGMRIRIAKLLIIALALTTCPVSIKARAATSVGTWAELQSALASGGDIVLSQNLTATGSDTPLEVPVGVTVTLSLNGCTIDGSALTGHPVITVLGNMTLNGGSGVITGGNNPSGNGGGIYLGANVSFGMNGGTITNCSAANGGGIYAVGPSYYNNNAGFELNGVNITGNTVTGHGGGIYVDNGKINISGGSISQNTASGNGGGIYASEIIFKTTYGRPIVSGNQAGGNGGGICGHGGTIQGSGFDVINNQATGEGGGIYVHSIIFTSETYNINGNTAQNGGGIMIPSGAVMTIESGSNISISDNTAQNGGGVYAQNNGSLTCSSGSTVFNRNTATGNGSSAGKGGGLYSENSSAISCSGGTLTFNSCTATGTSTSPSQGGGAYVPVLTSASGTLIFNNNSAGEGGGLYCVGISTGSSYSHPQYKLNLEFNGNQATGTSNYQGLGGGIYTFGEIVADGIVMRNNVADGDIGGKGGGFYGQNAQDLVSNQALIVTGNRAGSDTTPGEGGGVYARDLVINNGATITGNSAGGNSTTECKGGGVYLTGSLEVQGITSIYRNTAVTTAGDTEPNDVLFTGSNSQIKPTGDLTEYTRIGVASLTTSQASPANLVDWTGGSATVDNFFGDTSPLFILGPNGETLETRDWNYVKDHLPVLPGNEIISFAEEDSEVEAATVPEDIGDRYLGILTDRLAAAIALGGKQTIYWNEGTALPYSVMKTLQDNPNLTLVFSYTYLGVPYKVTIPGSAAKADLSIPWYGPLYLYAHYGRYQAPIDKAGTSTSSGTYVVKEGDTLSAIAFRLRTTVNRLAKANNIVNPDRISIGQVIKY